MTKLLNYNDLRIKSQKALIEPATLFNELPIGSNFRDKIHLARGTTQNIIQGLDDRLLVIVGPCSIHDIDAALDYAAYLKEAANQHANELFIIMRVYFEKPRTTIGWKGLISDPHLDGSFDMNEGLKLARKLLLELSAMNVPAGTEFLDTITPQYLSDLISWCAIGARTSESQIHRELASGLAMPVGFKNSTDGNIKIAIDAVDTARYPHHYLSINQLGNPVVMSTTGNNSCHIILRGSNHKPNYSESIINETVASLENLNLIPRLVIDCSHGNSMKNYNNQISVAHSIAKQVNEGSRAICGVMIESNLVAGNQIFVSNHPLKYGQSITDACISWKDTDPLLKELALAVKKRRKCKTPESVGKMFPAENNSF